MLMVACHNGTWYCDCACMASKYNVIAVDHSHPTRKYESKASYLYLPTPLLHSNQGENVQLADIEKVELIYSNKGDTHHSLPIVITKVTI